MRVLLLLFSVCLRASGTVVSWDMCADQWALWLLGEESIQALSAGDSAHYVIEKPAHLAVQDGRLETVLALAPQMVLADTRFSSYQKKILERRGIRVVVLPEMKSFDDVKKRLLFFREHFPLSPRGLQRIQEGLAFLEQAQQREPRYTGFFLSVGGLVAGPQTLMSDILRSLGVVNPLATGGWHYVATEKLLRQGPQIIFYEKDMTSKTQPSLVRGAWRKWSGIKRPVDLKKTLCFVPTEAFMQRF